MAVVIRAVLKAGDVTEAMKEAARRIVLSDNFADQDGFEESVNARQLIILGIFLEAVAQCKDEKRNAVIIKLDTNHE